MNKTVGGDEHVHDDRLDKPGLLFLIPSVPALKIGIEVDLLLDHLWQRRDGPVNLLGDDLPHLLAVLLFEPRARQ